MKIKTIIAAFFICLLAAIGVTGEETFELNIQKIPPYTDPNPEQMLGVEIFEDFTVTGKSVRFKSKVVQVDPKNFVTTDSTIVKLFKIRYTRKDGKSVFVESRDTPPVFTPLELKKIDNGSGSTKVKLFDGSEHAIHITTFGAPVPKNGFQSSTGKHHWGYKFFIMADTDIQATFYFVQVWTGHTFSVGARKYEVRIPNQPDSGLFDFQYRGNQFYHWVNAKDDLNTSAVSDLPGIQNVGEGGVLMKPPEGTIEPLKEGDRCKDKMEFAIYVIIDIPGYKPGFIAVVKWGYETDYTVGKTKDKTVGLTAGLPMKFFTRTSSEFTGVMQIYKNACQNLKNGFTAHKNIRYASVK